MPVAFGPAVGFTAQNCGVIALGDASLNVREALEQGGNVIVVPDHDLLTIARLEDYPALQRVQLPTGA